MRDSLGRFKTCLEDRFCLDCPRILSRYNKSVRCNVHSGIYRANKYPSSYGGLPEGYKHSEDVKLRISKGKTVGEWKEIKCRNPELVSWMKNKRNREKRNSYGNHTFEQWEELKKKYNYTCLSCNKKEPEIKLTEDHVVPLSKGGSDYIENIQPLCRKCNSKKLTKIINYKNEYE